MFLSLCFCYVVATAEIYTSCHTLSVHHDLPILVKGYGRVPEPLRRVERNGKTPDQQLLDGLDVIDREIAQMTRQLAEGDLDLLATRGRYLQIKYQGDDTIEG